MDDEQDIGRCEAYDLGEHVVARCPRSGRSLLLADGNEPYLLCGKHADAEEIVLPDEHLR